MEPSTLVATSAHTAHSDGAAAQNSKLCHNQYIGRLGEDTAVEILSRHGWRILERNWRCRYGEADIIASKGDRVAFFEVKTRSSRAYGCGAEAITAQKLKRMRRVSAQWFARQGNRIPQVKLVVIEVQLHPQKAAQVRFIEVGS